MEPKVFVVILNYQGKERLSSCLRSVFSLSYRNFETVIVDNASWDGSIEDAKTLFPRAHFIINERNVGFAAGMNVGMRFAFGKGAEYIWILNNDTIAQKDTLSNLVSAATNHPKSILSPKIVSPSGEEWFSSGEVNFLQMRAEHVKIESANQQNPYESGYLTGCALFFPAESIKEVGLFDERYFLYYEDADFSLRAKKAGYQLFVVPTASITHAEQSEAGMEKIYWLVRSGLLFFDKHTPLALRPWMFLYILLRKMKNMIDKQFGKEEAFLVSRAYEDFWKSKKS